MGGFIYLIGSPLFWGVFLLAAAVSCVFGGLRRRRRRCRRGNGAGNAPGNLSGNLPGKYVGGRARPDDPWALAEQQNEIKKMLADTGYGYDCRQNIFYALMNAWQRKYGYCRLYDESIAPFGMIVDCEPIYFYYGGREWLIELWKGQYGMTTGCEIGVYTGTNRSILGSALYENTGDADLLNMSFTLLKNNRVLFSRSARHWWLTGFRLGEFSQPWELTLEASLQLKDAEMCAAFVAALRRAGYTDRELRVSGSAVSITFSKPHTRQPASRTRLLVWFTQRKNKLLIREFNRITRGHNGMYDVLNETRTRAPLLYDAILDMGRASEVFRRHERELGG